MNKEENIGGKSRTHRKDERNLKLIIRKTFRQFPAGTREFFLLRFVYTISGAYPAPYPGTGGSFPGGKATMA
jgi:hypothetical protein